MTLRSKPELADFLDRYAVSGVKAYVATAVLVVATTALRYVMNPVLGDSAPYAFQAVAALAISAFAGTRPGIFGIFLAVGIGWFFVPPYDLELHQKIAHEITILAVGTLICIVTSTMRTALIKAARSQREADYLGREMHHRVKNLFAVVASMTTLSARERPDAAMALNELRARIQSLSQAHDVAVHEIASVTLTDLMARLMAPYKRPVSGDPCVLIRGDEVVLPHACVTPLALVFHEMATNAVKYGALSTNKGHVRLSWQVEDDKLEITWQEFGSGDTPTPDVPGFGTVMVDASVAQMRGSMDRELNRDGMLMRLCIPLQQPGGKQFPTENARATQAAWTPSLFSSSARLGSRRYLQGKRRIRDSRS